MQLAGGSNQDRMSSEYRRISAKAGKLLKSRSGYVTEGKDYFRLLVGPFDDKSDSQAFVNKLEKEGVDGFSWTRTPRQDPNRETLHQMNLAKALAAHPHNRAAGPSPRRIAARAARATPSSATATGSSIRSPSAASATRRRCSSRPTATISGFA